MKGQAGLNNELFSISNDAVFKNIINNIDIGVSIISPDMKILFMNRKMKKMFPRVNVAKTPLCYKAFNDPPRQQICSYCPTHKTLKDGKPHESVTETPFGNDIRNYRVISSPITNNAGKIISAIEVVEDITERMAAENRILQSKKQWDETFDTIPDMITIHDKDFNIIKANRAAKEILKLPSGEGNGMKCFKYYHGADRPPENCPSCKCLKTKKSVISEYFEPHMGMFIEIRAIPQFDGGNKIPGLLHVVRDISERKKIEDRLRNSENERTLHAKELTEANSALTVLLSRSENYKKEIEEKVMTNFNNLVSPFLEKLKVESSGRKSLAHVNALESSIRNIVSPFSTRLSSRLIGLTPREIHVASLIRDGRQSKDIADMLHMSLETVNCHRQNIRKKLGIKNKKINLMSSLLKLSE